jgi:hypothetical protein
LEAVIFYLSLVAPTLGIADPGSGGMILEDRSGGAKGKSIVFDII